MKVIHTIPEYSSPTGRMDELNRMYTQLCIQFCKPQANQNKFNKDSVRDYKKLTNTANQLE